MHFSGITRALGNQYARRYFFPASFGLDYCLDCNSFLLL